MSKEDWEKLEEEEGREEIAHVARDIIKTTVIASVVASGLGVVAGGIAAIAGTVKSIIGVNERREDREGD